MTKNEIDAKLQTLAEEQLQLTAQMAESDAHASKCVKLGIKFQDAYPDDFLIYTTARDRYNANEVEIARLQSLTPDEEPEA